ncbi:protein kinase, putative [Leishmania guyanensis]|uniref:Protein kinase domain-containing protein n=2 Tax=Leishmania guyanensis species complex TaxID=38579 RepID=A0AAW3C4R6_9TRYP|nr:protein kinase, putative [Leishmania guyanensis]
MLTGVGVSAVPPSEAQQGRLTNMDPSVYAVFEECRYKSLLSIYHLSQIIDFTMCGFSESTEVADSAAHKGTHYHDCGLHSEASTKREELVERLVADAAISSGRTEDLPLFIPFMDDNSDASFYSMVHVEAESSSNASCLGCLSENAAKDQSKQSTALKATSPTALGSGERDVSLFPHFNGHWECGIFSGKRVYIQTGGFYLGRGATAMVYEGWMAVTDTVNGSEVYLAKVPVAIKEVTFNAKESKVRNLYELALKLRLDMVHPGIVHSYYAGTYVPRLADFCRAEKAMVYAHLVLARSVTGSVADVLKRTGPLPESEIKRCMAEILSALQCIHEDHNLVHNDVKPHNILIFDDTSAYYADFKYQITDFTGIAPATPIADVLRDLDAQLKQHQSIFSEGGTVIYMSPESCLGMATLTSNDVWSLGITAFHMATGTLPWGPLERQYPSMILNGYRQKYTLQSLVDMEVKRAYEASSAYLTRASTPLDPDSDDKPRVRFHDSSAAGSRAAGGDSCTSQVFRNQYKGFGPILDVLDVVSISSEFRSFLAQCLIENPVERPTCRQLRSHPFLRDVKVALQH